MISFKREDMETKNISLQLYGPKVGGKVKNRVNQELSFAQILKKSKGDILEHVKGKEGTLYKKVNTKDNTKNKADKSEDKKEYERFGTVFSTSSNIDSFNSGKNLKNIKNEPRERSLSQKVDPETKVREYGIKKEEKSVEKTESLKSLVRSEDIHQKQDQNKQEFKYVMFRGDEDHRRDVEKKSDPISMKVSQEYVMKPTTNVNMPEQNRERMNNVRIKDDRDKSVSTDNPDLQDKTKTPVKNEGAGYHRYLVDKFPQINTETNQKVEKPVEKLSKFTINNGEKDIKSPESKYDPYDTKISLVKDDVKEKEYTTSFQMQTDFGSESSIDYSSLKNNDEGFSETKREFTSYIQGNGHKDYNTNSFGKFNLTFGYLDTKVDIQITKNNLVVYLNTNQVINPAAVESIHRILLESGFDNHNLVIRDKTKVTRVYTNKSESRIVKSDSFSISA